MLLTGEDFSPVPLLMPFSTLLSSKSLVDHQEEVFYVIDVKSMFCVFRIENRSEVLPFRLRQAGGASDSWQLLAPGFAISFAWEDLERDRQLEVLIDGADPLTARKFCIDDVADYQPMPTDGGPVKALHVKVSKEGRMKVVKVADWKPSDSDMSIVLYSSDASPVRTTEPPQPATGSDNQFHAIFELAELGISIVDHTPEELLYVTMQNLVIQYATGLGSGTSR
jgi:vacuolar protein sorting-associated protein 13A/C